MNDDETMTVMCVCAFAFRKEDDAMKLWSKGYQNETIHRDRWIQMSGQRSRDGDGDGDGAGEW